MSEKELVRIKILAHLQRKEIKQKTAAEEIGICLRQIKRLLRAYRSYRERGLFSRSGVVAVVHGLDISLSTVYNIMIAGDIWRAKKNKKMKVYQMREPCAREGELVRIDGSTHDWFEERAPKCSLLVYIDDATGKLLQLYFTKVESTSSYFEASKKYIERHGIRLPFIPNTGVFSECQRSAFREWYESIWESNEAA